MPIPSNATISVAAGVPMASTLAKAVAPCVLKADGLAAGKGVVVCQTYVADQQYSQADVDLLAFVGQHIGSALVRVRAIEALSRLGTRGLARRLTDIVRSDHSPDVRRIAEVALARAGGADAQRES